MISLSEHIGILGFVAATLGTIALIPQVLEIWLSRSAKGVSLVMYIVVSVGSILWIIYGVVLVLYPIIIQSTMTLICSISIIIMTVLWK